MKEIENPMTIDSLWDEIDEIEREEEAAWWYEKADEDHDEYVAMRGR